MLNRRQLLLAAPLPLLLPLLPKEESKREGFFCWHEIGYSNLDNRGGPLAIYLKSKGTPKFDELNRHACEIGSRVIKCEYHCNMIWYNMHEDYSNINDWFEPCKSAYKESIEFNKEPMNIVCVDFRDYPLHRTLHMIRADNHWENCLNGYMEDDNSTFNWNDIYLIDVRSIA